MKKIKYKLNKQGIGTTPCPNGFTTFVGNRIKRVGSDCMFCRWRHHIDFDNMIVECSYGNRSKKDKV